MLLWQYVKHLRDIVSFLHIQCTEFGTREAYVCVLSLELSRWIALAWSVNHDSESIKLEILWCLLMLFSRLKKRLCMWSYYHYYQHGYHFVDHWANAPKQRGPTGPQQWQMAELRSLISEPLPRNTTLRPIWHILIFLVTEQLSFVL